MKRRLSSVAAATGILATSVTLSTGAGGAQSSTSGSTTGVTAKTITVGQVDTLSGPVPGLFLGAKDGTLGYLNYINSQGGVYGRKLRLISDDDSFSSGNYATFTQELVNSTFALVGGFSLFDNAGVPAVNAAKIPDITPSLSAVRETDQYNYSPVPIVDGGSRTGPLTYYKKKYGSAYQHVGTIDSAVATAESQTNGVLNAMRSVGYRIVYQHTVNPVESQFTPDILRMRNSGVQMVYIVGLAVTQVADLAKQMQLQGFHPKFFATNGVAYDSSYIPDAGSSANNTYTDQTSAMFQGQDAKVVPAVSTFDKWTKAANPSAHIDTYALFGWLSAELFVQALKAAGPNPTRAALFAQLNKISSFSGNGLIATTNPVQKKPNTCWIEIKVSNGNWGRTTPSPKSGFVCNPGGFFYPKGYHFTRQPPPT